MICLPHHPSFFPQDTLNTHIFLSFPFLFSHLLPPHPSSSYFSSFPSLPFGRSPRLVPVDQMVDQQGNQADWLFDYHSSSSSCHCFLPMDSGILLVSRSEEAEDEDRVNDEGNCYGNQGVHEDTDFRRTIAIFPQPFQYFFLLHQVSCKSRVGRERERGRHESCLT